MGDDYIPGNKYGLSAAGMEMLSGVAVARGFEDVSGSATYTPLHCTVKMRARVYIDTI